MERYSRHIVLNEIGLRGQKKLSQAKVLVIGAGGLGCPALQYLVAAGIGTIGIIDHDSIEISNLQRQILFGTSSLGENKALAAQKRLTDLNPEVDITAYPFMLQPDNAVELFEQYDIIVDGSDNFPTRYLVNDTAIICNKPFVYGAIYKFEGQVAVFNYNNGPTYRCLFAKSPKNESQISCSDIGVLGVLPGIIGAMQANEVIKIVLGMEDVLSGQLLCYDAKKASTYCIEIKRNDMFIQNVINQKNNLASTPFKVLCTQEDGIEISVEKLRDLIPFQIIDVRQPDEMPKLDSPKSTLIPLEQLKENLKNIDENKTVVCVCQTGKRSLQAAHLLKESGIEAFSLKGGVNALITQELHES